MEIGSARYAFDQHMKEENHRIHLLVLVGELAPANWNILGGGGVDLSYDLQIDDTLAQGCDVTFSALGVAGDIARQRSGRLPSRG